MVFSGSIWWITAVLSLLFGVVFAMRVGGADMPITISLLNSLSGVAGGIAGIALGDPVLIAVGGIVGASGLLLTQIMCRAMNRRLIFILLGKTAAVAPKKAEPAKAEEPVIDEAPAVAVPEETVSRPEKLLADAKDVIIVPGYGMALSQAQQHVRRLADTFEQRGARVRYAIHPVAGRMPGHMNVLLCEADVPYEQLFEMDDINADFASCDLAIAIGANDTINPAANTAEGTPIYGMPVLDIGDAKNIFVLNFDDKPGYAGVPNPLYTREDVVFMMGDAKESINKLLDMLTKPAVETVETAAPAAEETGANPAKLLANAKDVIIVPGYGMALSQAQQNVKSLADAFEQKGARVRYAIHPVAGRMPGHMNVLLCEADVPYEQLFEMDDINADFASCDLAIAIGANDTINPAANPAEGTPIYGMPVLDIGNAKNIFVLNFDDKPGYAGVPNPLYTREDVVFMMGDAKDSINKLMDMMRSAPEEKEEAATKAEEAVDTATLLANAKDVIIVPGYGMALSQAQQNVRRLADAFEQKGAKVRYAIHPVAGRMPGHMNVLLCEADVPYEQLFEMDDINADFNTCDLAIAIGANDTINPAANTAEGTPIYGMPVLDVGAAKNIIILNFDDKPGYAGVPNPLYSRKDVVFMMGDAKDNIAKLLDLLR